MSASKIIAGMSEAIAFMDGDEGAARARTVRVPDNINVKAVREKLGMSQPEFAINFGIPLSTLRNWEQGRRRPEAMARVLLRIIDDHPDIVERTLSAAC
jgi:putative transcriptional regulator